MDNTNIVSELIKVAKLVNAESYLDKSTKEEGDKIFTHDTHEEAIKELQEKIKAPYVNISYSTLGGNDKSGILISVSTTPREEWTNKIFENSTYMRLHLYQNGRLEQFSGHNLKFRKTKVKSIEDAVNKINKTLEKESK